MQKKNISGLLEDEPKAQEFLGEGAWEALLFKSRQWEWRFQSALWLQVHPWRLGNWSPVLILSGACKWFCRIPLLLQLFSCPSNILFSYLSPLQRSKYIYTGWDGIYLYIYVSIYTQGEIFKGNFSFHSRGNFHRTMRGFGDQPAWLPRGR